MSSMSEEAREARREYYRGWYAKNRERVREQAKARQARYWEKKAAARIGENPGAATNAGTEN